MLNFNFLIWNLDLIFKAVKTFALYISTSNADFELSALHHFINSPVVPNRTLNSIHLSRLKLTLLNNNLVTPFPMPETFTTLLYGNYKINEVEVIF